MTAKARAMKAKARAQIAVAAVVRVFTFRQGSLEIWGDLERLEDLTILARKTVTAAHARNRLEPASGKAS
jgi:hypothetical protein